ncbi:extracellular solute-binding protein [Mycoplasmatota bacterium]|nr:extracellular solute-binding protein [Mycoplasmatota bacterium]
MKKITSLFCLMFLAIALNGCTLLGTEIDFSLENKTVITFWADDEEWADALIDAFEEQNPDIIVKFNKVGSVDVRQKMELAGPAGLGADVFVMPHDHIGAALEKGLLLPVGGKYKENIQNRIIESAVNTVSVCYDIAGLEQEACNAEESNKYTFAFPISGESLAVFYNKDLLLEHTGSEVPAATFEEIFEKAATYNDYDTVDEDGNPKLWFGADVGNAYDMHWLSTAHGFKLFGDNHLDPTQPNFNSPEMIAALTKAREIRTNYLNKDSGTLNGDWVKGLFEAGKLAYTIDGPWSISRYKDSDINFGVMKFPTLNVNGKDEQPYTFSGVQVAAVYRGAPAERQKAALKFAEFMISDEGMSIMYEETGKLPTLKNTENIKYVIKDENGDPVLKDGKEQIVSLDDDPYLTGVVDQLEFSEPMPIITQMGFFWTVAGPMYSDAWNGTTEEDGKVLDYTNKSADELARKVAELTLKGYNDLLNLSE